VIPSFIACMALLVILWLALTVSYFF